MKGNLSMIPAVATNPAGEHAYLNLTLMISEAAVTMVLWMAMLESATKTCDSKI